MLPYGKTEDFNDINLKDLLDKLDGYQFETSSCNGYRIYYLKDREFPDTQFYAIQWSSSYPGSDNEQFEDIWQYSKIEIDILFHGWAAFDGVRHIYWNPYLHCLNLYRTIELLQLLIVILEKNGVDPSYGNGLNVIERNDSLVV